MEHTPTISIIVPVYKVEQYLRRCLDSIQNQTFTDWECILIDDGSPDHSGEICDEYAQKDERFRVIHQENKGVSAARNAGLDAAKGEWIGFVDSDDWIEPEMYQFLYHNAIEKKADVVICGFVGQHKKKIVKMCGTEEAQKLLFDRNGFGGFSWLRLIAAEKVKYIRFDTQLSYLEDASFFFEVFKGCDKILWNNKPLYHYEQRGDSVTSGFGYTKQVATAIYFLECLTLNVKSKAILRYVYSSLLSFYIGIAMDYVKANKTSDKNFIELKTKINNNKAKIVFNPCVSLYSKVCFVIINSRILSRLFSVYKGNKC